MSKEIDNVFNLSDDEFQKLPLPNLEEEESMDENPDMEIPEDQEDTSENTEVDGSNEEDSLEKDEESDSNDELTEEDLESEDQQENDDDSNPVDADSSEAGLTFSPEQQAEIIAKVFAPFKANGKEIQVQSVDDVISLMQMGANYNKKMSGIKPYMGYLKMLQKHKLLDEAELSYLIDLKNKDSKAIAKLLQDSEIDLYNFDTDQANDYLPGNYAVSKEELALEEALQDIQHSSQYQRTVQTLGVQWDISSREKVAKNPQIIGVINQHMESGLYDYIWEEVERQRLLGYLKDTDDLQAYYEVGEALNKSGRLKNPNQLEERKQTQQVVNKQKQNEIRKKKIAAKPSGKSASSPNREINILAMSDEEFEKFGQSHLM